MRVRVLFYATLFLIGVALGLWIAEVIR